MTRRPLAVLAVVAVLAACGNSAPSKKAFLEKADAACKPATDEALALTTPADFASLRHFHLTLADRIDKTADAVEKLKFPGGADGEAARAWVRSFRGASGAARQVVRDVDVAAYAAVEAGATKVVELVRATDSQGRSFGFAECGRGEADVVGRMAKALPKSVKDAFVHAVNEVCKNAWAAIERLAEPKTLPEYKARLDEVTVINDKAVAGMKAIAAPSTDKALFDELVAALEKTTAQYKKLAAEVAANRPYGALVETAKDLTRTSTSAANAFGTFYCSRLA